MTLLSAISKGNGFDFKQTKLLHNINSVHYESIKIVTRLDLYLT